MAQTLSVPVFVLAVAAVWLLSRTSGRRGLDLTRLLLLLHFLLLTGVLIFSVITKPSANPHGLMAGIAVMIAVSAMACQFALFRLALPGGISTAVMTGNLTNTVLSLLEMLPHGRPLMAVEPGGRGDPCVFFSAFSRAASWPQLPFPCWETGPGYARSRWAALRSGCDRDGLIFDQCPPCRQRSFPQGRFLARSRHTYRLVNKMSAYRWSRK